MDVGAFDPFTKEWKDGIWCAQSLSQLLKWSDVLSLHIPLNSETRQVIGELELALLPQNAVLVNTSRGELIDEKALVQALEIGRLRGAALDVVAHERDAKQRNESQLLAYANKHDNLLILPYIVNGEFKQISENFIICG